MSRRPPLSREPTTVTVDGFTHGGEGVARIEGKAVFVPGGLPGETLVVRVTDDRRRWARAQVVDVVDAAPDRVSPPCPYVPDCGGCDLQHAAPDAQRTLKTRVVREQLERLGGLTDPPVEPCRSVGPDIGYRTSARLHAAPDGRLGYHRAGSNEVVPVDRCLVLRPATQAVRDEVGDGTGAVEVTIRAASEGAVAVLRPGEGPIEMPPGTIDLGLEQPDGSVIAVRGEGVLTAEVGAHTYRYGADAFFQVSPEAAAAIVDEVLAAAGEVAGALVWDLYAGVGLLSLPLAAAGAEVVAVEGDAGSARWARENATAAGLHVDVVASAVADHLAAPDESPDLVVLDPPRVGAGPAVCAALAALRPARIVYVSCDPAALARDAAALAGHGYRLRRAVPLDLFPMTSHVEVVATFDA